ncbi:MAG: RAMP superfamily CRISPR-associated protein, partial [Pseudomonas sp.]|uniref:RAMP superfamily CRISPR-associated protein n=1 Tax=Pseudomonas sp. TaxID=306 RepID=UPI00391ADA05
MFKELRNEAVYRFQITTESPFVIKSGEEDILDPTAAKSQVLRAFHHGERQVVIPGSSLKGVFRSRAEQLMRTMGSVIDSRPRRAIKEDTGQSVYEKKSDAGQQLFGSTALKGRIY